jgi:quercetin dioxygenase-like cupin family protein
VADGCVAISPGHLVVAPPDEAHWHGAAKGADCTMLAITWGTTCWHEEVPDLEH